RGRADDHVRLSPYSRVTGGACERALDIAARRPTSRFPAPEQSPGFLLWRATLSWQRRIRLALAPHELTHVQFVLLASLWWLEDHSLEAPTQASLAEQAGTDPMMTSQVLRKLETRGLLERAADARDN